jgi:hypothetical protein
MITSLPALFGPCATDRSTTIPRAGEHAGTTPEWLHMFQDCIIHMLQVEIPYRKKRRAAGSSFICRSPVKFRHQPKNVTSNGILVDIVVSPQEG